MALKDFVQEKATLLFGSNALELTGLSTNDVLGVLYEHKSSLEELAGIIESAGLKSGVLPDKDGLLKLVGEVALRLPYVVAALIARGCREPDAWEKALGLPMPVQLDALTLIAGLTFNDRAGFETFAGNVTAAIASVTPRAPRPNDGPG